MEKIRAAVIGVGQIGERHLVEYGEFKDEVEVVAVCSRTEERAQHIKEKYEIPDAYTDFRTVLERDDIELVDVCLHNNLHRPVAVEALRAQKHVYCEKPIAGSYVDGLDMVQCARENNLLLHVQLEYGSKIYTNEMQMAKELVSSGRLGNLYHARSAGFRRRMRPFVDGYGSESFVQRAVSNGGALLDMGVYHLADILYLMDNPKVESITGKTYQEIEMDPKRKSLSGYDVEEIGMGFVRMEKNISLDVIEAWAVHLDRFEGSYILGSKGGLRLDPLSLHTAFGNVDVDSTFDLDGLNFRSKLLDQNSTRGSSIGHLISALRGKVQLMNTAELALNCLLITEGIYLSNALGREVTADEIAERSESSQISL